MTDRTETTMADVPTKLDGEAKALAGCIAAIEAHVPKVSSSTAWRSTYEHYPDEKPDSRAVGRLLAFLADRFDVPDEKAAP